jgi:hypothetical protein
MTEREILATADHPFIVTLYWSFQSMEKVTFPPFCGVRYLFYIAQFMRGPKNFFSSQITDLFRYGVLCR